MRAYQPSALPMRAAACSRSISAEEILDSLEFPEHFWSLGGAADHDHRPLPHAGLLLDSTGIGDGQRCAGAQGDELVVAEWIEQDQVVEQAAKTELGRTISRSGVEGEQHRAGASYLCEGGEHRLELIG